LLAESKGVILDNEELIKTLQESKVNSADIKVKFAESEKLEKEINETRNLYRSTAIRGSLLYFVISDLGRIDAMYQFSL
jgi:dynein heavy chain